MGPADRVIAQTTWHVDSDCAPPGAGNPADPFCTIQQGVDAASDGDVVLVAAGTYTGAGNRDISLYGKAITLKSSAGPSETALDIQGSPTSIHRGFFLIHNESHDSVIEGFTIKNGYLVGDTGGSGINGGGGGAGIYIRDASPTVRDCIIRDNVSETSGQPWVFDGLGAGIYVDTNSNAAIEHCHIVVNTAAAMGGGLRVGYEHTDVMIRNCMFAHNSASNGAGVYAVFGAITIIDSAVVENTALFSGGGIHNEGSQAAVLNCVLWGNQAASGAQAHNDQYSVVTIDYSDVQGGLNALGGTGSVNWGPGNIDSYPQFVNAADGNFRLLPGSPCIDAGDNFAVPYGVVTDLDGLARFADDPDTDDTGLSDGVLGVVDMGAYEFGGEDCNNNGILDAEETAQGGTPDCNANSIPDECEPDCNANLQADLCDIEEGTSDDCNGNSNPDECDTDCHGNGHPDDCDIAEGTSEDCNVNGVPDECDPDCNNNDLPDDCDIADGTSEDCNLNLVPDECEDYLPITDQPDDQAVEVGGMAVFSVSVQGNLLEYQWRKDGVDLVDTDRIFGTNSPIVVIVDVQPGDAGQYDCVVTDGLGCIVVSEPATLTVIGTCAADLNADGAVNAHDLAQLLVAWGPNPGAPADFNGDGSVNAVDLVTLLAGWGLCE
jgi:hypothetical protein